MKKLTRFVAMVMTLSMLAVSAFAETTDTAAAEDAQVQAETVATDEEQQAEDVVLATVNGENVMQSDVDAYAYQIMYYLYSQGYDVTNSGLASQIQSMAIQGSVEQTLFYQKAHEKGFDQFTAEEEAELMEDAPNLMRGSRATLPPTSRWRRMPPTLTKRPPVTKRLPRWQSRATRWTRIWRTTRTA